MAFVLPKQISDLLAKAGVKTSTSSQPPSSTATTKTEAVATATKAVIGSGSAGSTGISSGGSSSSSSSSGSSSSSSQPTTTTSSTIGSGSSGSIGLAPPSSTSSSSSQPVVVTPLISQLTGAPVTIGSGLSGSIGLAPPPSTTTNISSPVITVTKPRYGSTPTEGIKTIPIKTYGPAIETKGTIFEGGTKPLNIKAPKKSIATQLGGVKYLEVEKEHAGGKFITSTEYLSKLAEFLRDYQNLPTIKSNLETTGQQFIDFSSSTPVEIEGEIYSGEDVTYKVKDVNLFFMLPDRLAKIMPSTVVGSSVLKGKEITMTAEQYDKYSENIGKYYLREAGKIDLDASFSNMVDINKEISSVSDWRPGTKVVEYDPYYLKVNPATGKLIEGKTEGVSRPGSVRYIPDFAYPGAEQYWSIRRGIEEHGVPGKFALALTPGNFAGIPATTEYLLGNQQKAWDIEVKAVYGTQHMSFLEFYLSSPMGVIGLTAISYGATSALSPTIGALSTAHPVGFAVASNVISSGTKVVFTGLAVQTFEENIRKGEVGQAVGSIAQLGLTYYGMSAAGKAGMTRVNPKTGQTYFAEGAYKGELQRINTMFDKDANEVITALRNQGGQLTLAQEQEFMTAWKAGAKTLKVKYDYRILSDLGINKRIGFQPEPQWDVNRIENISDSKFLDINKNLWTRGKSKLIGGLGSNKPITGDIDEQFTPWYKAETSYVLKNYGYNLDISEGIDWHYLQKTGTIVSTHGGLAETPYSYPSGGIGIKWREQITRLFHSGWNPAHLGRIKDISEGLRMVQQVYPQGLPPELGFSMDEYVAVTSFVEKYPTIMQTSASNLIYGPSPSEIFKDVRSSFYEKVFGWKFEGTVKSLELAGVKPVAPSTSPGYLPPSISSSYSNVFMPFTNIAFVADKSVVYSSFPNIPNISITSYASPKVSPLPSLGTIDIMPSVSLSSAVSIPKVSSSGRPGSSSVSKIISSSSSPFDYSSSISKSVSMDVGSLSSSIDNDISSSNLGISEISESVSPSGPSPSISGSYYFPPPPSVSPSVSSSKYSPSRSSSYSSSSPPYIPILPSYFPKLSGMGGDWGFGKQYGKKKRYRKAKTIDPFADARKSMEESIDFGLKDFRKNIRRTRK